MAQQGCSVRVQVALAAGILILYQLWWSKSVVAIVFSPWSAQRRCSCHFQPFPCFPKEGKFLRNFVNDYSERKLEISRYACSSDFQSYTDQITAVKVISLYCLLNGASLKTTHPSQSSELQIFQSKCLAAWHQGLSCTLTSNLGSDFSEYNNIEFSEYNGIISLLIHTDMQSPMVCF